MGKEREADLADIQRDREQVETEAAFNAARGIITETDGPWAVPAFKDEVLQRAPEVSRRAAIYILNDLIGSRTLGLTPDQQLHRITKPA